MIWRNFPASSTSIPWSSYYSSFYQIKAIMFTIIAIGVIFLLIVALITAFTLPRNNYNELTILTKELKRQDIMKRYATKKASSCSLCSGKEVVNCGSCNGSGIDKKNGSVLERWCCKKCKGIHPYIPYYKHNSRI